MVQITAAANYQFDLAKLNLFNIPFADHYNASSTLFQAVYPSGTIDEFRGVNLVYGEESEPVGGTFTNYALIEGGQRPVAIDGFGIAATTLVDAAVTADQSDDFALFRSALAGDDQITGGNLSDNLQGFDGNDVLRGNGGNDVIDGGAGHDTAIYAGFRQQHALSGSGTSHTVVSAAEGSDTLTSVEQLNFLDGQLSFDVDGRSAVVYRMYDAMFDRAPDALGFEFWTGALERGTDVQGMASYFAASPEFTGRYGNLSNQGFVEQLYQNVLGRAGEADGVVFWTDQLNRGALNRGQVLAGFSESAEHKENLRPQVEQGLFNVDDTAAQAARVYSAAFDRNPDVAGLTFWTNALKSGAQSAAAMTDFFVQSAEFAGKYGALTNGQFVDQIYHNVLDRAGDPDGTAFWTGVLDNGTYDRGDVLLGFSESAENVAKTLPTMTSGILLA